MVSVMTPKEKAEQLYTSMRSNFLIDENNLIKTIAKNCALVALNELVKESSHIEYQIGRNQLSNKEYWQQVIMEIIKL
jgi:hypothetical protein